MHRGRGVSHRTGHHANETCAHGSNSFDAAPKFRLVGDLARDVYGATPVGDFGIKYQADLLAHHGLKGVFFVKTFGGNPDATPSIVRSGSVATSHLPASTFHQGNSSAGNTTEPAATPINAY